MRSGSVHRKTRETDINLTIHVDGGPIKLASGVPFMDHMLDAFACHGRFGLELAASGDVQVDPHHLVEDTGIVLGQALRQALVDYRGIERAGCFSFAMDGTLTTAALDLCGRGTLVWGLTFGPFPLGNLDPNMFRHFFKGFADEARCALHFHTLTQDDDHHLIESAFKGFGRALRRACEPLGSDQILSTKGTLSA